MPPTPFSDLDHAGQLELLEKLTRAALPEYYDIDAADLRVQVQQYEGNAVWRVTPAEGSSYVARLSIRDDRPAHQQHSEMRWLESLAADHTVTVPAPLTTRSGHYIVPLEVPGYDQPATLALLHWVPGTAAPAYQEPTIAEDMGAANAYLHDNAAKVELPDFERPVWDAETILITGAALTNPTAREQLGPDGLSTLRAIADQIMPVLSDPISVDHSRIHGDLHRENMIALPGGGVGIIDFDDCGTGHPVLDIATVLSSIHRIARTQPGAYDEFTRRFLRGYTRVRPVPTGLDEFFEPYLILRDVFVLNFVAEAIPVNAAVAEWGPDRIAGILADMGDYLAGQRYPGALSGR